MEIRNYTQLERSNNPHGVQVSKIYDTQDAVVMHLLLRPNESLKPHVTPVDVAFYVLEGRPTILIGDEKVQVNKDDIVDSPKNIVHCVSNESDRDVRVLVMKLPRPMSKTKIV